LLASTRSTGEAEASPGSSPRHTTVRARRPAPGARPAPCALGADRRSTGGRGRPPRLPGRTAELGRCRL